MDSAKSVNQLLSDFKDVKTKGLQTIEDREADNIQWLDETFKATRKRLRIDIGNNDENGESPKVRSRKDTKAVLSPRDPNVVTEPVSMKKADKSIIPIIETAPVEEPVVDVEVSENTEPTTKETSSDDLYQTKIDAAKLMLEGKSFKDLRKDLKERGLPSGGKTEVLRERLLSAIAEEILTQVPESVMEDDECEVVAASVGTTEDEPATLADISEDLPVVEQETQSIATEQTMFSPVHASNFANEAAQVATPSSSKKPNVFNKMLSGGKKFLSSKKTPGKTPGKKSAKKSKSPPRSTSKARGSLAPQVNIEVENMGTASGAPVQDFENKEEKEVEEPEMKEVEADISSSNPSSEKVEEEVVAPTCDDVVEDEVAETVEIIDKENDVPDDAAMDIDKSEAVDVEVAAMVEESKAFVEKSPVAESMKKPRASSPLLFSPEQPVLSTYTPVHVQTDSNRPTNEVLMTVADVLSDALKMSDISEDVSDEVATKAESEVAPTSAKRCAPVTTNDVKSSSKASIHSANKVSKHSSVLTKSEKKPGHHATAPHVVSAAQIKADENQKKREKQLREHAEKVEELKIQKEKKIQEKELEREQRIREQKEKAALEAQRRKEALKEKAMKKLQKYETHISAPVSKPKDTISDKSADAKGDVSVAQRVLELQKKEDDVEAQKLKAKQDAENIEVQRLADLKQREEAMALRKQREAESLEAQRILDLQKEKEAKLKEKQDMENAEAEELAAKKAKEEEEIKKREELQLKDRKEKEAEEERLKLQEEHDIREAQRFKIMQEKAESEAKRRAEASAAQAAAADEYDSYCMSEPEEQEQDDSGDENASRKAKKRIPKWASKEVLKQSLTRQAELSIDPDSVFFECDTCDLEDIFQRSSKRYHKRTSSANWNADKLSMYDKLVYKRSVGKTGNN